MARTMSNDPLQRFRFKIEIDGVEFGARTVTGLEKELEVAEYAEGGYKNTHKLPGRATTGVLVIEKGVFGDTIMYSMVREAIEDPNFRKRITIIEQNRRAEAIRQWTVEEAWASKITAPELDAESSDVSVETIEIQYEDLIPESL